MWVPIPFERTFRLGYSRTRYGTGYYIYHLYDTGAKLSQPIRSWDGKTPPDQAVLDLIARAGTDLSPKPGTPPGWWNFPGSTDLSRPMEHGWWKKLSAGPATIRALEFTVPRDQAVAFGQTRLRITWDSQVQPSIDAPMALFFGAGTLYNRENAEYLVKAFPVHVRFSGDTVRLACYLPIAVLAFRPD